MINSVLNNSVIVMIIEKLFVVIECMNWSFNLGILKIFLIVKVFVKIFVNMGMIIVIIGIKVFLSVCLKSICIVELFLVFVNKI